MFTFFLKEIRQLRRDMVFWGALIVQTVLSMFIILLKIYFLNGLETKTLFSPWFATLGFAAAYAVAIASASRWNGEMNDDALNPIVTTPLPPVAVTAGKYLATVIAVLTPVAIAQIFVGFTIPKELAKFHFSCGLAADAALLLLMAALLLVCASISGKHHIVGVILPGVVMIFSVMGFRTGLHQFGLSGFERLGDLDPVFFLLLRIVLVLPLLFAITTAAVSVPSSDRAIPVRIVLVFTIAAYILVGYLELRDNYKIVNSLKIIELGFVFSIYAALAQRRAQSARIAAAIRRLPPVLRPLRILCSTGALQELLFSLVLFAAAMIVAACAAPAPPEITLWEIGGLYVSLLFCAALALAIACAVKRFWSKKLPTALMFVIFVIATMILGSVLAANELLTTEKHYAIYIVVASAASLVLLIPTAWEFADSLKRR